jgi:hypothetical protein
MGQEIFNAAILAIAVVMLISHNVWMAHHGRELAQNMRAAGRAVAEGSKSLLALAVVVGVAVLREGSRQGRYEPALLFRRASCGADWCRCSRQFIVTIDYQSRRAYFEQEPGRKLRNVLRGTVDAPNVWR